MFCIYKLGVPWIPPLVNNYFNLVIFLSILTVYICHVEIYCVEVEASMSKNVILYWKKKMHHVKDSWMQFCTVSASWLSFMFCGCILESRWWFCHSCALLYLKMVVPFNFNEAFKSLLTTMKDFGLKKLDALDCFHVSEQSNWNFDFKWFLTIWLRWVLWIWNRRQVWNLEGCFRI